MPLAALSRDPAQGVSRLLCPERSGARPPGVVPPSLALIRFGKFVGVAQHYLPLSLFPTVRLCAAKSSRLRVITDVPGHVLQVNGEGEVGAHRGDDVLNASICRCDAARRPVQTSCYLLPTALAATERPHDDHVVGVRPKRLERFRTAFDELIESRLAFRHEPLPGRVHERILPDAAEARRAVGSLGAAPTCRSSAPRDRTDDPFAQRQVTAGGSGTPGRPRSSLCLGGASLRPRKARP
jgi:hypothetical protein